jgi:hypothetical protein
MFEYLHEAMQHTARALKQKKAPPVRPKPPTSKPSKLSKPLQPSSEGKAQSQGKPAAVQTKPSVQQQDGVETAATGTVVVRLTTPVDNNEPAAQAPDSPLVPKRTRSKPQKRIALKQTTPAYPGRTTTSTDSPTTAPLARSSAIDPDPRPAPPVHSSPALKRKGQHTDFSNPSVSLSIDDETDNNDTNDRSLETAPTLSISSDLLSVVSTASLGSLRESPEPADVDRPERTDDPARPQSPVTR